MPFITKNGKPVWITPQRDTDIDWVTRKKENSDTIKGVKIPDYILHGKDDKKFLYSTEKENKEYEKEYRDHQKSRLQSDIMKEEMRIIDDYHAMYLDSWLAHNKKKEDIQIELSVNKKHNFHGKVWDKNRERKLEYEEKQLKDYQDRLDKLKKERKLYYD